MCGFFSVTLVMGDGAGECDGRVLWMDDRWQNEKERRGGKGKACRVKIAKTTLG